MSRNTFVFGIGGTGARVIKALTMLLASGIKLEHNGKIIPIIIDVDAENEDTSRTIKALDLYKKIRTAAYGENADQTEGFFGTPVNTLSTQQASDSDKINDSFQLKFAGIASTFSNYLRVQDMDPIDEDFLKLLYDSSPSSRPEAELNLSLTKGFKGNPNIGCIVFNELEQSPEFKYFQSAISEDDRIFIVSSIFGGTGSAGFPQLLKLLKNSRNNRVSNAKTGALTMMPYFAVQEDAESAIDSNRFISKTKAALSYYEHEMDSLNAMYYLYDKSGNTPYKNSEGGKAQKNDAHVAELIAAEAILNFTNKRDEAFESTTMFYEYGIKSDDPTINAEHFIDDDSKKILDSLTSFTYAAKAYLQHIPGALDEAFAKNFDLERELQSGNFYRNLTEFLKDYYIQWLKEMERNNRTFHAFQFDHSFNEMVVGKSVRTNFLNPGINDRYLNTQLGKIENELSKKIQQDEKRFLSLLYEVADKCTEKLK